jgi:ribose 5-phosphate isomerase B
MPDHAGFQYKERLRELFAREGHQVEDWHLPEEAVTPIFIRPVALAVARGDHERGIVLGGSGNGEAMAANRVLGVRCSLCWSEESARLARAHNDANVLSLGQRLVPWETAVAIVGIWLSTPFEGGRHQRRIALLDQMPEV